jgi:hypothetical protein
MALTLNIGLPYMTGFDNESSRNIEREILQKESVTLMVSNWE